MDPRRRPVIRDLLATGAVSIAIGTLVLRWAAGPIALAGMLAFEAVVGVYLVWWTVDHLDELPGPRLGWANRITASRLFLVPPAALGLFLAPPGAGRWAVLALIGALLATDWLDGLVARRLGEVTRFGTFLDPTADFFFELMLTAALAAQGLVPLALAGVVVLRVALLSIGGFVLLERGVDRTELASLVLGRPAILALVVALLLGSATWAAGAEQGRLLEWASWVAFLLLVASLGEKLALYRRLR